MMALGVRSRAIRGGVGRPAASRAQHGRSRLAVHAVASPASESVSTTPGSSQPRLVSGSTSQAAERLSQPLSGGPAARAAVAAPAMVAPPPPLPLASPAEAYQLIVASGAKIAKYGAAKTLLLGLYAGFFISMGGLFGSAVLTGCPGIAAANPGLAKLLFALVFPVGLYLNTVYGSELFTGNTFKLPAAIIEGKATLGQLAKNWACSYAGNLLGSLAFVGLVMATGVLGAGSAPTTIAVAKTSLPWGQAFARAVVANWLVCMAVWGAAAADSLPGKMAAIWPPICAFVAIGLEHSVANMFLIPLGMALGAPVTWHAFLAGNLLPVTLGNIVGGLVFVCFATAHFYGSLLQPKAA